MLSLVYFEDVTGSRFVISLGARGGPEVRTIASRYVLVDTRLLTIGFLDGALSARKSTIVNSDSPRFFE